MAAQDTCFLLNIHWVAGTKKTSKKEGTTETGPPEFTFSVRGIAPWSIQRFTK